MWSAASRYLARQDRDVCTTGRRQFDYLYAYLLDACRIADSDHSSVIEHARPTRDIILGASILIANIFLVTRTRLQPMADRRIGRSRRHLASERKGDSFYIFFFFSYPTYCVPVDISNATVDLAIAFRCARVHLPDAMRYEDIIGTSCYPRVEYAPRLFLSCSISTPKRRRRGCTCAAIATRPRGYPCHDITGTRTALDYWFVEEFCQVDG